MHTEEQRARWREACRRYRERHPDLVLAQSRAYRAEMTEDKKERVRERARLGAAERRRRPGGAERNRDQVRRWRATHKAEHHAANRRWIDANQDKVREQHARRRVGRAGVLLTVRVVSDVCGVCELPLTTEAYPHPLSTSVGHEPPLARARRDGWLIVAERPEHLQCNLRKHARHDYELEAMP